MTYCDMTVFPQLWLTGNMFSVRLSIAAGGYDPF